MSFLQKSPRAWRWTNVGYDECDALPVTDRGFRYGMAVFESLRVTNGLAEFFDKHVQRLIQACAERGFPDEERAIAAAAQVWSAEKSDGFGRIYVTAGDGGPADPITASRVFISLEPRTPPNADDPWELTIHEETHRPAFPGLKTANYWSHCDALAQARQRGFDETLLFNERAELVSASMANVFVLRDERLCTPPRSSGCRTGVIREWVIGRRKVEERRLTRKDVLRADEIFLTNSWIGVMPVATLEGRPLGPRSLAPRLAADLENRRVESQS